MALLQDIINSVSEVNLQWHDMAYCLIFFAFVVRLIQYLHTFSEYKGLDLLEILIYILS